MDPFINATPRPWVFGNEAIWSGAFVVVEFDALNGNADEREANARLIVAAVNERDALREALRRAGNALETMMIAYRHHCEKHGETGFDIFPSVYYATGSIERIRKLLESGNG